jgi:hypothetical protein
LLVGLSAGGCGDSADSPDPPPSTPLARTLAEIGGGGENASLGVSWADRRLVAEGGFGAELIPDALAPNADTVVEAAARLRERFGFDPLAAERYVAVGGSYAFGLRLDGVDGRGLARALIAAGGRARDAGSLELIEIGDWAVVPEPLLSSGVNGLGAFDAFGPELAVLAISDRARAALLGDGGGRLLDEPTYAAAADCLGDVVAARMIPDKQLLSVEVGVDLVAVGVRPGGEVLCVLGGTPERAAAVATALETSLAPSARDPATGERFRGSIAGVAVSGETYNGVEVVRAELTPAPGSEPGFLFGTVARGSLVALINGAAESFPRSGG